MKVKVNGEIIKEIMSLKKFESEKAVVYAALTEYLKQLRRMEVLKWKGSNFWEGNLDEMRND